METILTTLLEDAWYEVQNMCDTWVYEELGAEIDHLTAERDRYKEALEILSSIYFYGNFKPETYNESLLEQMLTQFGLWPTTEDEIIKRSIAREALKEVEDE